jgi:hypothetical protein
MKSTRAVVIFPGPAVSGRTFLYSALLVAKLALFVPAARLARFLPLVAPKP